VASRVAVVIIASLLAVQSGFAQQLDLLGRWTMVPASATGSADPALQPFRAIQVQQSVDALWITVTTAVGTSELTCPLAGGPPGALPPKGQAPAAKAACTRNGAVLEIAAVTNGVAQRLRLEVKNAVLNVTRTGSSGSSAARYSKATAVAAAPPPPTMHPVPIGLGPFGVILPPIQLNGRGSPPAALYDSSSLPQPQFPSWPLPPPSSRMELPDALLVTPATNLQEVDDRLTTALSQGGFGEHTSFYWVGRDGFIIITKVERIQDDGTPLAAPDRWSQEYAQPDWSLKSLLKSILVPPQNRERFIILLVTPRTVLTTGDPLSATGMEGIVNGGAVAPPAALKDAPLSDHTKAYALVYEFYRANEFDTDAFVTPDAIDCVAHLVNSHLWTMSELGR